MKTLMMTAAALALFGAASANAQPPQDDHHGNGNGQGRPAAQAPQAPQHAPAQGAGRAPGGPQFHGPGAVPQAPAAPQVPPRNIGGQGQGAPQGFQARPQGAPQAQPQAQGAGRAGPQGQNFQGQNRGQNFQGQGGPAGGYGRGPGQAYRPDGGGAFNGGHSWRSAQRFQGRAYAFPGGFGVRAWAFGQYLPRPLFMNEYLLYDYWNYGLPQPAPGFEWLRVGPDALMVRPADGYILDVAQSLFY